MTDISGLQRIWEKELVPIQEMQSEASKLEQVYLARIEKYGDTYKDAHGWSRLKKVFAIATRVAPLRRKKMKIEKHLEKEKSEIKNLAASMLSGLTDTVARNSVSGVEFKYLETAIRAMQDGRDTVNKAAKKCRNAGIAETGAAISDNISIDRNAFGDNQEAANKAVVLAGVFRVAADITAYMATRNATKGFREAKQTVESLQETVREAMPQVNGALANSLSSSNDPTLMMDTFGGILASLSNWETAGQLLNAKDHLHEVSKQLDETIGRLSLDKGAIAKSTMEIARTYDSNVAKFATELETGIAMGEAPKLPEKNICLTL